MTENVGYAALQIIPSMKGFESKLTAGTSGPLSSAGNKGGILFGDAAGRSMSSRFSAHAKAAAFAAGAALAGAGALIFKIGKDSISEAREAQRVGNITKNVIESTGHAAKVTASQVGDLATKISNKVGIDDEAIQSGANMLLTFKGIRDEVGKGNKIFDQATRITTNMAVAMAGGKGGEVDLKSSAILVGKALNDPAKGLTALTRVGVTFDDQQRKQIATLIKNHDTLGAQKIMLKELKSEFGGTAAAQATMGDKVKVAWGNIEEKIGTDLLPLVDKVERYFLHKGVPAVEHFFDRFEKKGVPAIKDFYDEAKPVAESLLPTVKDGLQRAGDAAKYLAPKIKSVVDHFNDMPDWVKTAVFGAGAMTYAGKKLGAFSLAGKLLGRSGKGSVLGQIATKASPLPVFVTNPNFGGPGGSGVDIAGTVARDAKAVAAGVVGTNVITGAPGAIELGAKGLARFFPVLPALGSQVNPAPHEFTPAEQKAALREFKVTRENQAYAAWLVKQADAWKKINRAVGDSRSASQDAAKGFGRINTTAGEALDLTHKIGSVRIAPTYDPKGFGDARRNASDLLDLAHKANGVRVAPQVDTSGVNNAISRWDLLIARMNQAIRLGAGAQHSTGGHVAGETYDPRIDLRDQKNRANGPGT